MENHIIIISFSELFFGKSKKYDILKKDFARWLWNFASGDCYQKKLKLENKELGLLLPELGQSLIIVLLTLLDHKKSL